MEMVMIDDCPRCEDPPAGAWLERTFDGFRVGGSTRSIAALVYVPFFLIWTGGVVGGIYGPLLRGEDMRTDLLLVGIPFVFGSVMLGILSLKLTLGRMDFIVDRGEGRIFTGVGPIGTTRRFRWDEVDMVREELNMETRSTQPLGSHFLVIEGAKRIRFGIHLDDMRRKFVFRALKTMLAERG
jgi:hypothetical protein